MEERFTGMMITLKKRMVCTNQDDTTEFQYLMFGHYDGADIICTDQWYQLRPKGVASYGGNVDVEDSFWDKYTLKLYFPQSEFCRKLEKDGFSYEIWEKLGYYNQYKEECYGIQREFPFISIAMINLSEKCVKSEEDLIVKMQLAIKEAANQAKAELNRIHCAIMPSIGYADFVLLFLSDDLKKVITVLDCLRKTLISGEDGDFAMLSNSYAISGFAKAGLENLHCLKNLDEVKLSIRVNLRDGVSAAHFKKFFNRELKSIIKEEIFDLYQVLGNSDCLVLPDMPFYYFIPLYYDAKLLNPAHKLFDSFIQDTHSSIRVRIDSAEELGPISSNGKQTYMQYQNKFQELIGKLELFVDKYDFPIRTVNGLQTIMKAYLSLVQFSHCFDIEKVIGAAFEVVADNVERTMELIQKAEEVIKAGAGEKKEELAEEVEEAKNMVSWYSAQMMEALKIFREKIEDYLSDLRRSDCLFIEGQSLSHPSIGSATKLLFFYNCYINDMAKKLTETEEEKGRIRFTFLVTSGGCDVTTAYDLFSYMDPIKELAHSLVIISIPEMSLYDFRGTMFRLLHECLHFCGERKREERREVFFKALSVNTAQIIGNGLCKSFDKFLIQICDLAGEYYPGGKKDGEREKIQEEIWTKGNQIVREEADSLITEIEEKLCQSLEAEFIEKSRDFYYGRNMYIEARKVLEEIIWKSDEMDYKEVFLYYTYHRLLICQRTVAEKMILNMKDCSIPFSDANILKETSLQKQRMEEKGRFDDEEEQVIRAIFRNYCGNTSCEDSLVKINETERITIDDVVIILQDVFKECYADCIAAKILQLPVEDFLLCFLYETWDYKKAFPDMFRIAIELKVLYGIQGELGEEIKQKIKKKVAHWKDRGFEYQHHNDGYIDDVCQWINGLLEEYIGNGNSQYVGMKYIEEYLSDCLNFYKVDFSEEIAEISRLSNMSSIEEIHQLLEWVRGTWKNLSERRKDCA